MEYLIISHDPERWNFSENTDLSGILFIARKHAADPARGNENTPPTATANPPANQTSRIACVSYVSLWQNPDNPVDGLLLANEVNRLRSQDTAENSFELWLGDNRYGEVISVPSDTFRQMPHWLLPCAFAQRKRNEALMELMLNKRFSGIELPLTLLKKLAKLRPDRRAVKEKFEPVNSPPGFAVLWGHDSEQHVCMHLDDNAYLKPKPKVPRNVAQDFFSRFAGQFVLAEPVRLNTYSLMAGFLDEAVLSNV
ncbi:MAG: hypothetical protein RMJ19_05220 [Gemmatales bacterium]|nr:hypothetical protein [Gemmatales bacterium]MDW8175053.1 hypothetical protein [Gemmatales bacterium]